MKAFRYGCWVLLVFVLTVFTGCAEEAGPPAVSAPQLTAAIDAGMNYMVGATKSSGEFVYLDNLDPNRRYKPVYNVLRHAGTMYALADAYGCRPNPEAKAALLRAAKWLQTKYIKPVADVEDVLAVWSLPSDRAGDGPTEIKLGGIGLGLVGLLKTEEVAPGTTSLETLRKLGNGIIWLQKPDGNFYSKYDAAKGGKIEDWISLYYPGEAALGLAMLAEHDPDVKLKARWLNAAFRAVGALARARAGAQTVPADHWVLIATAHLWPQHAFSDQSVTKVELLRHAVQICNVIVKDAALRGVTTTPIATRVEGMNAALTFLPPEHQELRDTIQKEIESGVVFLLKAQVPAGSHRGAMPRALSPAGSTSIDRRANELRIDYIQHSVSAWLEYGRQNKIISTP